MPSIRIEEYELYPAYELKSADGTQWGWTLDVSEEVLSKWQSAINNFLAVREEIQHAAEALEERQIALYKERKKLEPPSRYRVRLTKENLI